MSIASEISRLQNAKAGLKTSIEGKGVSVPSSATLDDYPALVDSIEQGGGGGSVPDKDVQYIDYDGSIVAQYDSDEFLALTAHPSNPDHISEGLLAQGWNWTLSDAKTYVTNHGMLVIGQMYTTTDGATRIKIDTSLLPTPNKEIPILIQQNVDNGTTIDWGDGSPIETFTGKNTQSILQHSYITIGEYTIKITPTSNTTISLGRQVLMLMTGSSLTSDYSYNYSCIKSINTGNNVNILYAMYCFNCELVTISKGIFTLSLPYSHLLKSITLPDTMTSFLLRESFELERISINNGHTSLSSYALADCYKLRKLCLPDTITTINNYALTHLYNVKRLTLPNGVTNIANASGLYNLESLVIPDGITTIGNYGFQNVYSLKKLVLGSGLKSIGLQSFEYCISLKELTFGNSLETIGAGTNPFLSPQSLEVLVIPDTVKSIGNSAFQSSGSLKTLVIGSGVTSIGSSAFRYYSNMESITIKATTPPTLGTNAFGNTNNCPIYVPSGCLATYQSATGWTAFASRMVESNS